MCPTLWNTEYDEVRWTSWSDTNDKLSHGMAEIRCIIISKVLGHFNQLVTIILELSLVVIAVTTEPRLISYTSETSSTALKDLVCWWSLSALSSRISAYQDSSCSSLAWDELPCPVLGFWHEVSVLTATFSSSLKETTNISLAAMGALVALKKWTEACISECLLRGGGQRWFRGAIKTVLS